MKISRLIPFTLRKELLKRIKRFLWPYYIKIFYKAIKEGKNIEKKLLRKLIFAWGNEGFSAKEDYLLSIVNYARSIDGNILETGSGLSTIILNIIANQNNKKVFSLEHDQYWADKSIKELCSMKLSTDGILKVDLKSYGDFEWYNVENIISLFKDIQLIICDGPPGKTRGGRFGLMPLMQSYLKVNCIILVDDIVREQEKNMINKWKEIVDFYENIEGTEFPYAILILK